MRILDTDIASYLIKDRRPSLRPRFLQFWPGEVGISAVGASELLFGLQQLDPEHSLNFSTRRFLTDVDVLAWDLAAAEVHAEIRYRLRTTGKAFGEMDMLIAAHAISLDATLVTNNTRHFGRLEPLLTIENWVGAT